MSEVVARYQFFHVVKMPLKHKRTTHDYRVVNSSSGGELGRVYWYPQWRQYVLEPWESVWSAGCLKDIVAFVETLR